MKERDTKSCNGPEIQLEAFIRDEYVDYVVQYEMENPMKDMPLGNSTPLFIFTAGVEWWSYVASSMSEAMAKEGRQGQKNDSAEPDINQLRVTPG